MIEVGVVGLGSWGLCALERIVTGARRRGRRGAPMRVHVIEPAAPGAGVYGETQPDYLLMNNPCGQLSMYPDPIRGRRAARTASGSTNGPTVATTAGAAERAGSVTGARSRRTTISRAGSWPSTCSGSTRRSSPRRRRRSEIVHHGTAALDIVARPGGREGIVLASGGLVCVDYVILTSGHTANAPGEGARPST